MLGTEVKRKEGVWGQCYQRLKHVGFVAFGKLRGFFLPVTGNNGFCGGYVLAQSRLILGKQVWETALLVSALAHGKRIQIRRCWMRADERLLEDLLDALDLHTQITDVGCGQVSIEIEVVPSFSEVTLMNVIKAVYDWCERWLEDPQHDVLRARGDKRWHVVSDLQRALLGAIVLIKEVDQRVQG